MTLISDERQALAETLRITDPHAPTLCAGWDVQRLLAHLVVRESEPITVLKDVLARQPPGAEPGLTRLVDAASTPAGYQALVDRLAAGPGRWSPRRLVDQQFNLVEYIIHHEDIRRAGPGSVEPRALSADVQDAAWKSLGLLARLGLRKCPVGVTLTTPTGAAQVAKKGSTGVTLSGDPVELALYLSGRRDHARVQLTGPDAPLEQFATWIAAA